MADFWVNGIVAARNGMPYVQLSNEKGMIAQLSVSECRQIAMDMLNMAARTECDAMVLKFFKENIGAPDQASAEIMALFRDFRHQLDEDRAGRSPDKAMAWDVVRTDFGRFIIIKESDPTLAWTGSLWDKHIGGVPMGEAQIANFDSEAEARQYARETIFERPQ